MPKINAALENQQADHQLSMFEVEVMIQNKTISIFIDLGANLSYVSPSIEESCKLHLKILVGSVSYKNQEKGS